MIRGSIKSELITMIIIAIVSYLIFSQLDVLELIVNFSAKHEEFEIDGNYSALSAVRHIATLQKQSLTWFFCIFLF